MRNTGVKATVTKDYIARQLSYRNDMSMSDAKKVIDQFVEILADSLAAGNDVEIRGLMSMTPYNTKEKVGRMGKAFSESVIIPSRKRVKVKVSKMILSHINKNSNQPEQ